MGTYSNKLEAGRLSTGVRFEIENPDGSVEAWTLAFAHTEVNKRFGKAYERLTRPYRGSKLSTERSNQLYRQAFVETIVLGWEGVTGERGEVLPFTAENVLKTLTDLPTRYDQVHSLAANADNFREVPEAGDSEADSKNSSRSSSALANAD